MGTPASGTITLDEVHVEAGGSSGSQASFNDSDIRLISGSNQNTQFSMSDMYARAADFSFSGTTRANSQTTSSGYITITSYIRGFTASTTPIDAFPAGGTRGSMSPTSEGSYFGGSTITSHSISSIGPGTSKTLAVFSNQANATNSDTACFKSMVIGSTTFNRTDATFTTSAAVTSFTWSFAATNDGYADITSTQAPYPAPNTTYTGSLRRRV